MLSPGIVAHGIGGIQYLPVPTWLFFWGGAVVLVVSFIALGALWRSPQLAARADGRALSSGVSRLVLGPMRIAAQALSVVMLVLVLVSAIAGVKDPFENLAPTWVYVVFWLGIPLLSFLFGNVWRALSPWRALADGFVWLREVTGGEARPLSAYPERLGRIPGAVTLLAFTVLELCYWDPSSPRALAAATILYSYVTLFGMAAFGRVTWSERGEGFAILFAYIARMAPVTVAGGRLRVRVPFTALGDAESVPGSALFLAVALGSVGFDAFGRTVTWQDLIARVDRPFALHRAELGKLVVMGVDLLGLLAAVAIVGLAFYAACAFARSTVTAPRSLVREFVLSLVPIVFVYEVAHYFSLFVLQGQFVAPLLSDPLGKGWDLFGTAGVTPNLSGLTPNTVWYVQASVLVAGHVVGLVVGHDRGVAIFRDREDALRSQYAMLGLMVFYAIGGLWLLSRL